VTIPGNGEKPPLFLESNCPLSIMTGKPDMKSPKSATPQKDGARTFYLNYTKDGIGMINGERPSQPPSTTGYWNSSGHSQNMNAHPTIIKTDSPFQQPPAVNANARMGGNTNSIPARCGVEACCQRPTVNPQGCSFSNANAECVPEVMGSCCCPGPDSGAGHCIRSYGRCCPAQPIQPMCSVIGLGNVQEPTVYHCQSCGRSVPASFGRTCSRTLCLSKSNCGEVFHCVTDWLMHMAQMHEEEFSKYQWCSFCQRPYPPEHFRFFSRACGECRGTVY
jgi:hypothetical protein